MIETFDVGINFWEVNKELKVVEPFKSLYTKDKSTKKKDSSLMMWFVVLCYDKNSKFYRLMPDGEEGKHATVGEDFCNNINYYEENKKVLDPLIDKWNKIQLTPMERHLKTWEELLDKRTKFLESQNYNLDNYKDLDAMAKGTNDVNKAIKQVIDDLAKDTSQGTAKGGARKSLND